VRFVVTVKNDSGPSVPLQTVAVTLDYGTDRTPGLELERPGGSALTGEVATGSSAQGVYLFTVPVDQRDLIRITVDYSVEVAPIVFEGPGPR
jgi:hypothetical protein